MKGGEQVNVGEMRGQTSEDRMGRSLTLASAATLEVISPGLGGYLSQESLSLLTS